jgi:hypothetical protein
MVSFRFAFLILLTLPVFIAAGTEEKKPINYFAFGGVGFGGIISEGEKKFELLRVKDGALKEFRKWYEDGSLAERAYCMVAFHALDRKKYSQLKSLLLKEGDEFSHASGCDIWETS